MNDKQKRVKMDAVVTCVKVLSEHFLDGPSLTISTLRAEV
jgi:hypothetical protein